MADDLGWGDVGFNGGRHLRTPHLDRLAAEGLVFRRFYAASPVCSPTRGSCLTGRHPSRYGIVGANAGMLKAEERNLAQRLKAAGYTTGHFGKWHLGTLTTTLRESNRGGPRGARWYAPPWERGFDACFSTEAKVPTWDPMRHPPFDKERAGEPYGTHYWTGPGERVTDKLDGDDSRVIMDRAVPFIERAAADGTPFFAVIWFHTPHKPIVAGPEYRRLYADSTVSKQHYYGCITALDDQMGHLRQTLLDLGVAGSTLLWFASDNGPERGTPGSTGGFRERKRSLHEGGVRTPALAWWPGGVAPGATDSPAVTSDYLPTVLDLLGIDAVTDRPMDGVSLRGVLDDPSAQRGKPIGFRFRNAASWVDGRYKLITKDAGETFELYDLIEDPFERTNLAAEHAEIAASMRSALTEWSESCDRSAAGHDYR